ncbi:dopamine receptor 2 isoform X1 [Apis mellifera caucasica]|nr:dopamine receptor 2 isoform X1 [Apis mellifera caucasica]KAG9428294.1 dopamine receptor 2 isoform X1 [Apis mellifera carnica]
MIFDGAFVRILCACCPGRVRRRYQPAFRCKPSQYVSGASTSGEASRVSYSSVSQSSDGAGSVLPSGGM